MSQAKPFVMLRAAVLLSATIVMAVTVVVSTTASAALTPHQEAINLAIEQGVTWLRSAQIEGDSACGECGYWDPGFGSSAYAAGTGMALMALVADWDALAGDPDPVIDDEHIRRALNWLLANQQGDGTWGGNQNYQVSAAIWGLAALLPKLPPGSPSIAPTQTAIDNGAAWLVSAQWDESCLWGSVVPSNYQYYGGFGYGSHSRPDLSNSQFAIVALKAAHLNPAADSWAKAVQYIESCQYQNHSDGGMWYTPDSPAWGPGSTGSMTGAGVWSYRLCGVPDTDSRVQAALQWLDDHYTYTQNPDGNVGYSHYYYLWSATKAFLVCDIKGEIGGLIPVAPTDAVAFYPGWYHDFSKYLVSVQNPDGHWNTGDYNGGPVMDTEFALFILQKEVGIPHAVQVSIAPDSVAVPAGGVAAFTVTVDNLGTEMDSYDMDVGGLPMDFSWSMADPVVDVPGGTAVPVPLDIATPPDLAIWVNTPYPFSVEATSLADPGISHATTADVLILAQATPISRIHYTDVLLDALMAEVQAAAIDPGVKNSLISKLHNAEKKKHQGLARLEVGDINVAENMFYAAANMLRAFINGVEAQAGIAIDPADAASFIAQAEDIIWRLEEGIWDGTPAPKIAGRSSRVPSGFALHQNYPNPFNAGTIISYTLDEDGPVTLEVFNVLGCRTVTLVSDFRSAGPQSISWDGTDVSGRRLASGMYFYRLTVGKEVTTRKMVLLK